MAQLSSLFGTRGGGCSPILAASRSGSDAVTRHRQSVAVKLSSFAARLFKPDNNNNRNGQMSVLRLIELVPKSWERSSHPPPVGTSRARMEFPPYPSSSQCSGWKNNVGTSIFTHGAPSNSGQSHDLWRLISGRFFYHRFLYAAQFLVGRLSVECEFNTGAWYVKVNETEAKMMNE